MKTIFVLLSLILFLYADVDPRFIAVNDLKGKGVSEDNLVLISNRLRTELFKTGMFRVMERSEMMAIAEEQDFQRSSFCAESECVVDFGRMLGVNSIIAGTVGKVEDFYTISIQLIDVETGEVVSAADYDYTGSVTQLIAEGVAVVAQELTSHNIYAAKMAFTIDTDPQDVTVELNDKIVGTTPFTDSLVAGNYSLLLRKKGFRDLEKEIALQEGRNFSETFTMKKEKSRAGTITRIISGVTAAGATALGIYANSKMDEYSSDAAGYLAKALDENDGASYNTSYTSANSDAERMKNVRNVSYSVAGASVVLFGVSFLF